MSEQLPKGFAIFDVDQSIQPCPITDHLARTGRALAVLWDQYRSWRFMANSKSLVAKRLCLRMRVNALIKADRILRGEA